MTNPDHLSRVAQKGAYLPIGSLAVLKMAADVWGHLREHRLLARLRARASEDEER